jgi:hypothetical protein
MKRICNLPGMEVQREYVKFYLMAAVPWVPTSSHFATGSLQRSVFVIFRRTTGGAFLICCDHFCLTAASLPTNTSASRPPPLRLHLGLNAYSTPATRFPQTAIASHTKRISVFRIHTFWSLTLFSYQDRRGAVHVSVHGSLVHTPFVLQCCWRSHPTETRHQVVHDRRGGAQQQWLGSASRQGG